MFSIKKPPFLVIPIASQQSSAFPENAGYHHHPFDDDKNLLSFGSGWTFPVPVKNRGVVAEPPLMLVRNAGGVTSESSTSKSGYAHQFVSDDGGEPEYLYKKRIFQNDSKDEWMLIKDTVNAIWLQFRSQYEYLGDSGSDTIEYQYGTLIILKLNIVKDIAPSLDRKADILEMHDIQYRVSDKQIFSTGWSMADRSTRQYLAKVLTEHELDRYRNAVDIALFRAGFSE